jgi:DNA-binding NtrC family response regulator
MLLDLPGLGQPSLEAKAYVRLNLPNPCSPPEKEFQATSCSIGGSMETVLQRLRDAGALSKLVGSAPVFVKAISQLPAVSKSEAAVMIRGETGTGKELVARAIHYMSVRAAYPFVALNCGSLPDTLLEDELFGHEKGAFTGAHARREGLIAQARKGTLFLDEVDTLSTKAQVDLLRVLQDKRFRAIGSVVEREADVRVVAATNASLEQLIRSTTFRADLYYRLCIFTVNLPPLRERKEDVLLLASHFLEKHALEDRPGLRLSPAARAVLLDWGWPGNVRELENAVLRAIHLCQTESIETADLGLYTQHEQISDAAASTADGELSFSIAKRRAIALFEKEYLTRLMAQREGNISQAARVAGKDRSDLRKLLKKHRLDAKVFRLPIAGSQG